MGEWTVSKKLRAVVFVQTGKPKGYILVSPKVNGVEARFLNLSHLTRCSSKWYREWEEWLEIQTGKLQRWKDINPSDIVLETPFHAFHSSLIAFYMSIFSFPVFLIFFSLMSEIHLSHSWNAEPSPFLWHFWRLGSNASYCGALFCFVDCLAVCLYQLETSSHPFTKSWQTETLLAIAKYPLCFGCQSSWLRDTALYNLLPLA